MPAASCRGRLGRKGSYHLKARKAGYWSCTCVLAFFIAHPCREPRRTKRCRSFTRPDKYVTVFLPPYRFIRSGGTPVRRLRAVRSSCLCGICHTDSGTVMRSQRSAEAADGTLPPTYRLAPPPLPPSFRLTAPHGVPDPASSSGLAYGNVSGSGPRAFSFRTDREVPFLLLSLF